MVEEILTAGFRNKEDENLEKELEIEGIAHILPICFQANGKERGRWRKGESLGLCDMLI